MNPIKRVRQTNGLSIDKLAKEIGVHSQALYLLECGVYPTILPVVLTYFVNRLDCTQDVLETGYRDWVKRQRYFLREKLDIDKVAFWKIPTFSMHPFAWFRKSLDSIPEAQSRMGFSKTFLVHPASLYSLEKGITKGLPGQLREALLDTGFTVDEIDELDYRCREFTESKVA